MAVTSCFNVVIESKTYRLQEERNTNLREKEKLYSANTNLREKEYHTVQSK